MAGILSGPSGGGSRESAATRLAGYTDANQKLTVEIANTVNALRDALLGKRPEPPNCKEAATKMAPAGFLNVIAGQVGDNNAVLSYALDELRVILGEVQ